MTSLPMLVVSCRDETFYSMMARASAYLGFPQRGVFHRSLFGADVTVTRELPAGLGAVAASGVFGTKPLDRVLDDWTLFPYYSHFESKDRVRAACQAMIEGNTSVHHKLGSWGGAVPPPAGLRFCLECVEEMLAEEGHLWWRRGHQMPSAMLCPDHGTILRGVPASQERRDDRYIPASLAICGDSAKTVIQSAAPHVMHDLRELARASDLLLDDHRQVHPVDRRAYYLEELDRAGMLDRAGEANLFKVAQAMTRYWGDTLRIWHGLEADGQCSQRWIGGLLWGGGSSPPLHHLLLAGMLKAHR